MTTFIARGYVEWDISGIPDAATVTKVEFRYHGKTHNAGASNTDIRAMANQPSGSDGPTIATDCTDGTAYLLNDAVFPEVGTTKDVGGASGPAWDSDPKSEVESALAGDWFAIGMKTQETEAPLSNEDLQHEIYSEEKTDAADPNPTLYVEYSLAGSGSLAQAAATLLLT